jgi:hypothetical protein
MKKEMEELYIEGLATHGGPEPCADACEGIGEALVGVRAGRAIEPRNQGVWGADTVTVVESNIAGGVIASRRGTPRGPGTRARSESSCARTGRSHVLPVSMFTGRAAQGTLRR